MSKVLRTLNPEHRSPCAGDSHEVHKAIVLLTPILAQELRRSRSPAQLASAFLRQWSRIDGNRFSRFVDRRYD